MFVVMKKVNHLPMTGFVFISDRRLHAGIFLGDARISPGFYHKTDDRSKVIQSR